ncbi:hypothetical protein PSPO01_09631 [Paraphaeosphaeria sporulosa]
MRNSSISINAVTLIHFSDYGPRHTNSPLSQLAAISSPPPHTPSIRPTDHPLRRRHLRRTLGHGDHICPGNVYLETASGLKVNNKVAEQILNHHWETPPNAKDLRRKQQVSSNRWYKKRSRRSQNKPTRKNTRTTEPPKTPNIGRSVKNHHSRNRNRTRNDAEAPKTPHEQNIDQSAGKHGFRRGTDGHRVSVRAAQVYKIKSYKQ